MFEMIILSICCADYSYRYRLQPTVLMIGLDYARIAEVSVQL